MKLRQALAGKKLVGFDTSDWASPLDWNSLEQKGGPAEGKALSASARRSFAKLGSKPVTPGMKPR